MKTQTVEGNEEKSSNLKVKKITEQTQNWEKLEIKKL